MGGEKLMGYYGVGAFENDEAQDFLMELLKSKDIIKLFENILNENREIYGEPARVIASIFVLLSKYVINPCLFKQHVNKTIQNLESLLENKEWLEDWNNSNSRRHVKTALKKQITALKNVYESC